MRYREFSDPADQFANVNTPEALERARAMTANE
jgi:molybdopterin-guanine dinucleotide biosynthesis protein A